MKKYLNLFIDDVYFDGKRYDLGFESEKWIIGTMFIRTPHGNFGIDDANKVNNDKHVGVEFLVRGLFDFESLITPNIKESFPFPIPSGMQKIHSIAFVRQPYNAWLWAYLFNEYGEEIVSFGGHEKGLDDFKQFCKDCDSEFFDEE